MVPQRRLTSLIVKSRNLILCLGSLLLVTCGEADNQVPTNPGLTAASSSSTQQARGGESLPIVETLTESQQSAVHELMDRYLQQASADFGNAQSELQALQLAVETLIASPDTDSLEAARAAWLDALNAYEVTLLHRYYAELILPEQDYLNLVQLDYRLNQWPILPGYIDAVANYPDSGIVFDPSVTIDAATLTEIHGQFDIAEAALGFHVLEFLLWGDGQSLNGPRGVGDFVAAAGLSDEQVESGLSIEQLPNNRRRDLLLEVTTLLNSDYEAVYLLWTKHVPDFQRRAANQTASALLDHLLQAVNAMLTEELLVRSLYPLLNGNYDESLQSLYSNATQSNVMALVSSIENVLFEISSSEGVRLDTLFSELSADFEEMFYQNFDASKECLVLLYSTINEPETPEASLKAEFEIVECINLLTNMIDHFNRIDQQLKGL